MSEEVTGSGELLSHVQELEDELKDSEKKRMDLIQNNTALQTILKASREQEVRAQQEIASLWERLVSLKVRKVEGGFGTPDNHQECYIGSPWTTSLSRMPLLSLTGWC